MHFYFGKNHLLIVHQNMTIYAFVKRYFATLLLKCTV